MLHCESSCKNLSEVIPNYVMLVLNMYEEPCGVRKGKIERAFPVNGRGKGSWGLITH